MIGVDGRVAAVLDWELCTLGDPLADLGLLLVYWTRPGDEGPDLPTGTATALPGFRERSELLARYVARSGADVNAVVCLHGDLATTMPAKKGDIKAAVFVIHGSKDPVAPKADRDALEAELDGVGANWQMLTFGGRLHSFAEEETMMKGVAEYNAPAAHQTYRMLDDFIQDAFNNKL